MKDIARQAMICGASQNEAELADALDLVAAVSPSVIVEIGCDMGGTLYAWRQLCDRVYGITTEDNGEASGGSGQPLTDHGAEVILGDSHGLATLYSLGSRLDGDPVDVLVLDGDHHVDGVHQDLAMYGPLVRPGGLILIHDINCVNDTRAETWKVWPELAERYNASEIRHASYGSGWGWGVIHVSEGDEFGAPALA